MECTIMECTISVLYWGGACNCAGCSIVLGGTYYWSARCNGLNLITVASDDNQASVHYVHKQTDCTILYFPHTCILHQLPYVHRDTHYTMWMRSGNKTTKSLGLIHQAHHLGSSSPSGFGRVHLLLVSST